MRFAYPWVFIGILLVPLLIWAEKKLRDRLEGSFRFSDLGLVRTLGPSFRVILSRNVICLRAAVISLVIIAAARPQSPVEEAKVYVEGIDIVLAMDTSTSMRAMDFEMGGKRFDRLQVVKSVVEEFIKKRPYDRIGIVAFAANAYTVCPLTLDHDWLERNLERVRIGMVEDGTAIGGAISASLNRLKGTDAKEKIIILLTDGVNNAGKVTPVAAAEAAKALGVKIYAIGAGTKGMAPYPAKDMFGDTVLRPVQIEVDEDLLKKIAEITDGSFFRATDTRSLWEIYDEIDKLEKTKIEEEGFKHYNELVWIPLLPALCLVVLEILVSNTLLRRLP